MEFNQSEEQKVNEMKKGKDIIHKNGLQAKDYNKRKRRSLYSYNRDNPENMIFIHIYSPNTAKPKYIKQILTELKGERNINTKCRRLQYHT